MYSAQTKMENEGVWETDAELLTAASLLDTDIYVYTQVSNLYKWHKFSKSIVVAFARKVMMQFTFATVMAHIMMLFLTLLQGQVIQAQHNSSEDSNINYFGSEDIFLPELSFQNHTDEM